MAKIRKSISGHFWSHIKKLDDCWLWNHTQDHEGYGIFHFVCDDMPAKRIYRAHVMSYYLHTGVNPRELDMYVIHSCDNKWCVNPEHLSLGNNKENQIQARDRGLLGDLTAKRKKYIQSLSEEEWVEWQKMFDGKTGRALANLKAAQKWRMSK